MSEVRGLFEYQREASEAKGVRATARHLRLAEEPAPAPIDRAGPKWTRGAARLDLLGWEHKERMGRRIWSHETITGGFWVGEQMAIHRQHEAEQAAAENTCNSVDGSMPAGFCQCGCGEHTGTWEKTSKVLGRIKGQPKRFVHNHHGRKSPVEYVEEDRGYETPCWVWRRATGSCEYGSLRDQEKGYSRRAHILYFERRYGPVPDGLELDHLCRVRSCVNPEHLEPVTHAENMRRAGHNKLSRGLVAELKAKHATGAFTVAELARMFGINRNHVTDVVSGKAWAEEVAVHRNDERKGS